MIDQKDMEELNYYLHNVEDQLDAFLAKSKADKQ